MAEQEVTSVYREEALCKKQRQMNDKVLAIGFFPATCFAGLANGGKSSCGNVKLGQENGPNKCQKSTKSGGH